MKITILTIDKCPNRELATERVRAAAAVAGMPVEVEVRQLGLADDAAAQGFTGSPTILVNGRNPFGGDVISHLACRRYDTPDGAQGSPPVDQIAAALEAAA